MYRLFHTYAPPRLRNYLQAVAAWMSLGSPALEGGSSRPSVATQQEEEPRPLAEPPVVHQAPEGSSAAEDASAQGRHTSEGPPPSSSGVGSDDGSVVRAWLRGAASWEASSSPVSSAMSAAAAAAAAAAPHQGDEAADVDQPPRTPGGGRSLDDANHLLIQVCERVKAQHGGTATYDALAISSDPLIRLLQRVTAATDARPGGAAAVVLQVGRTPASNSRLTSSPRQATR